MPQFRVADQWYGGEGFVSAYRSSDQALLVTVTCSMRFS